MKAWPFKIKQTINGKELFSYIKYIRDFDPAKRMTFDTNTRKRKESPKSV